MLKWLGGAEKSGHPQANPEAVDAFIAELPADDAVRASQEIVQWLNTLNGEGQLPLAQRFEAIDRMDAGLKRYGQRLLDQYLSLKPQAKFQEGLIWRAAMALWKALGESYIGCVNEAVDDTSAAGKKRLPQSVARAMRAQVLQIKWILLRYGHVSESYWATVGRLYAHAEAGRFHDEVIEIYPGSHGRGTVRQEFLRTLMLGVSSAGGLSPAKQHIAERAIAHFSKDFVSSETAQEGCNFVFDMAGTAAPTRVYAALPKTARLFYFGAGAALDATQAVIDKVGETGVLPLDMGLQQVAAEAAADTLLHLAFNWEKELPARDSERVKVAMTLQVTQGFEGALVGGESTMRELWVVENASEEGYGVIVPARRGEWLQVGVLIGFKPDAEGTTWGAAIVRRVETDPRGQRRVGLQVISRGSASGTMCAIRGGGQRGAPQSVVFLDWQPSKSGYLQILVRPDSFTLRDTLEATRTADGKTFMLTASGTVESGPDFERVRFKYQAPAAAAA
jgi:hypothetical protein